MLEETNREMEERWKQGYKKRQAHMMGPVQVCFVLLFCCFLSISIAFSFLGFYWTKDSNFLFISDLFVFHIQNSYYDDLAKTADIETLKPVITMMHNDSSQRFLDDLVEFRKDIYRIVDDHTFVKIKG